MNIENTKDMKPGEARCPGPSTKEIIVSDGWDVPKELIAESYEFLGDKDIDYGIYTSPDIFDLEIKKLWPKVWQWACREEHIAEPGDYYVYDVGPHSIIVVRTRENEIKAYYNACLHRGTQLKPCASIGSSKNLRCPFHGFTWSLDGKLEEVPCRWDFPHIDDEEFRLPEVKVGLWGGFVFINMDENAKPLLEYLGPLADHFANWPLENRYVEGRLDDVIVRGGENISPGEIEDALCAHPNVREAAVFGIPDEEWGEAVAAAVVLSKELDVPVLQEWVRRRLRSTKVPQKIEFKASLPYNDTGKLLRREAKRDFLENRSAGATGDGG